MRSLLLIVFALLPAFAQSPYRLTATYPIGGTGSWDYLTFDGKAHRLYVSHGTRVEVLDTKTGKLIGALTETPGVHGIAIAGKLGFTTNGSENTVTVFNPGNLTSVKKVDVGKGPDGIFYHAPTQRIFIGNHGSHDMTVLDAVKATVVGTIALKGDAESVVAAKDGLLYVNVEDTAEVAAFDPKTLAIVKRLSIRAAKVPTGLAYDAKTNHLFIACREMPLLVILDAGTGKLVATFPIGANADWAHYDASRKLVLTSSGEGSMGMFEQVSPTEYKDLGAFPTAPGAKTFAFDPKTRRIYLSTADFVMTPNGDPAKRPARTITPGTFRVLVAEPVK